MIQPAGMQIPVTLPLPMLMEDAMEAKLPLTIDVLEAEDHAVIMPRGYLNALTGDQIDKVCDTLLQRGISYYIVNFAQVETINTIGISILVGLIEKVLTRHGLVYFTELGGTTRDIFEAL